MQNKVSSVYVPAVEMQVSLNAHTPARVRAAMLAKRVSGAAGSRSAVERERERERCGVGRANEQEGPSALR